MAYSHYCLIERALPWCSITTQVPIVHYTLQSTSWLEHWSSRFPQAISTHVDRSCVRLCIPTLDCSVPLGLTRTTTIRHQALNLIRGHWQQSEWMIKVTLCYWNVGNSPNDDGLRQPGFDATSLWGLLYRCTLVSATDTLVMVFTYVRTSQSVSCSLE